MSNIELTTEQVQTLADYLCGTCNSLEQALEDLEFGISYSDIASSSFTELDNIVFCCTGCNWWCEINELNEQTDTEEWVCGSCYEAPEED